MDRVGLTQSSATSLRKSRNKTPTSSRNCGTGDGNSRESTLSCCTDEPIERQSRTAADQRATDDLTLTHHLPEKLVEPDKKAKLYSHVHTGTHRHTQAHTGSTPTWSDTAATDYLMYVDLHTYIGDDAMVDQG